MRRALVGIGLCLFAAPGFCVPAAAPVAESPLQRLFLEETDELAIELLPFDSAPLSLRLFGISSDDTAYLSRPPALTAYLEEPVVRPVFKTRRARLEPRAPLTQGTLIAFAPSPATGYQSWKAHVIDGHGRVVKEMTGVGDPGEIRWDGTEDGWMRVRAGEPYNVIFNGVTADGKTARQTGTPVVFDGVVNKTPERTVLMLAGDPLFTAGQTPMLTAAGHDRLIAVAAVLAAHPNDPVTIDIFSKDSVRSVAQRDAVVSTLASLLLRSPQELVGEVQVDPNEQEEIRIAILGETR